MEEVSREVVFSDGMFTLVKRTLKDNKNQEWVTFIISNIDEISRYEVYIVAINESNIPTLPEYNVLVYHEHDHFSSLRETAEYINVLEQAFHFAVKVKKYISECGYTVIE